MRTTEVPIRLAQDGRDRRPHLRTWLDGWRSLRFFLLYSPRWLFLYPGVAMIAAGAAPGARLLPGPRGGSGPHFDVHTPVYRAAAVSIGFQLVLFFVFGTLMATISGLLPPERSTARVVGKLHLEHGLLAGGLMVLAGLQGGIAAIWNWARG